MSVVVKLLICCGDVQSAEKTVPDVFSTTNRKMILRLLGNSREREIEALSLPDNRYGTGRLLTAALWSHA